MKKLTVLAKYVFLFIITLLMKTVTAQTGLNFQGVARSSSNTVLASQDITIRLTILQGSATGTAEYAETRKVTTNAQGLFTAVIGDMGALSNVGNFATINWKLTPKFLKIEMDPAAGANFITMGTTQFQSVAYAQFANSVAAENIAGILPVSSGGTGLSSLTAFKTALAIDKINNTADVDKPLSTASQAALAGKANTSDVAINLAEKVDKVSGKELSTNDFTTTEKNKLAAITGNNTGDQDLSLYATATSVALKVNTTDFNASLASKVDKVIGKDLSTNDFTTTEKNKLAAITGANTGDQDLSLLATSASVALKANTTDINVSLATKVDKVIGKDLSTNDFSTTEKNKLAAITGANTGDQDISLLATSASVALKENQSNKSTDALLGGINASDILFPTQKAVKDFVAANTASGGIADGGITTIKLADLAVTDAKLATGISKSKVGLGSVENTAVSTWAGTSNITTVGTLTNLTVTNPIAGSVTGNAATVTTNANLTGVVTSVGNTTSIASGTISNSMLANTAVANLSGSNTGDNAVNSNYSSLVSNAAHTGDATGSTALTVVKINGTSLAGLGTGILKNTTGTGVPSIAVAVDFPTLNQSTTGNAATVTTNANLTGVVTSVGNTTSIASGTISNSMLANTAVANLSGSNTGDNAVNSNYSSLVSNAAHTGDATGSTALTVVKINGTSLAGLGTGILKNTTVTGVPSIAVAIDFPTLNQSTTGNAATATKLATARNINGVAFDGSGNITIAAAANAETLSGTTINATITGSSLSSVGVLNNATVNGKVIVGASSAASASAILEASSTTQGFLPPRMTLEQRIAITSPAQGLMIYCTNCGANGEPEYFNGSSWLTFGGDATAKAIPTVTITVGNYTFTASTPQGPNAATNTGTGTVYTYSYVGTGSTTYGASSTKPINAGTYSATVSLSASSDGNYAASSSSAAFSISKAIPSVTPTIGTYTYNLASPVAQGPITATNTGTGTSYTFSYSGTGFTTYGPSATKPTDGGTYTVIATVAANGNHTAASSNPTAFKIALNLSLGNVYGGGKIAYILQPDDIGYDPLQQHGLIISDNLIGGSIIWQTNYRSIGAIGGLDYIVLPAGTSRFMELGAGINNTNLIVAVEGAGTTYAAGLAKNHTGGGYTNWYLPSFSELYGISTAGLNLGAPTHNYHWTSTEGAGGNAWVVTFGSGNLYEKETITAQAGVRAVRVF